MYKRSSIIIVIIFCMFAAPAYAYLDPGSGSIILQGLLAAIAGALAAIKLYWHKLKNFFQKRTSKNKPSNDKDKNES